MATKKTTKKAAAAKPATESATTVKSGEMISSAQTAHSYITGNTFSLKKVEYAKVGDLAIFEGDIILGTVAEMEAVRKSVESDRPEGTVEAVVITGGQFRWPGGVIPFTIDPALTDQARVTDAIAHIQANTNLRFVARTNQANFVTYRPGAGCNSQVGMRGGQQFVNLGAGCLRGQAIHETCHVAGLWHEQSREDRNQFVTINFANIQAGMASNFNQQIADGDDVGHYDYGSIMHYPRNAFAINAAVDTITPKPNPNTPIGQRSGLSAGDIAAINLIYPRKATLGDTSNSGPALTTRGGSALLAWTGVGNLKLNFLQSSNGLTWANKVTLNEISPAGPAVTVFNNKFVVAWIGVGNNKLNVLQSNNGLSWTSKVTMNETSQSTPALAVFGNRLFIAWRGVGNNQLNVMSSANGVNWTNKVTLADTTPSGPALCALGNALLIAWRGVGNNQLNVMKSTNGTAFGGKVTLHETTVSKPALDSEGNRAILTWQGVGNQFLNVLSSTDGVTWDGKFTSAETCIDGPAATKLGTRFVWGWSGTDPSHRLNTMLFNLV